MEIAERGKDIIVLMKKFIFRTVEFLLNLKINPYPPSEQQAFLNQKPKQ
jgi:hypothetical protein